MQTCGDIHTHSCTLCAEKERREKKRGEGIEFGEAREKQVREKIPGM